MQRNPKELAQQLHIEVGPLVESDIEKFDPILRQHIKDRKTGEILQGEIASIKGYMRGEKDEYGRVRKYVVAKSSDGRVIGCMAYSTPDSDMVNHFNDINISQSAELLNAFVDSELFRGGGVGRQLFEGICNSAKQEGNQYLIIHSGPRYKLSWPFYDKMCDENRGFIIEKYGKDGDAYTWLKRL